MTMPFEVKDTKELTGLAAGDAITFRMLVTDTEGWIDQIHKLDSSSTNPTAPSSPIRIVRDVEPLVIGDLLPEYNFTNQLGQAFSTTKFQGSPLAITFLFTRCPFPTFCPLMSHNFAEVQKKLLSAPGALTNWHLLTISFDPEFDKPAILKNYAERYNYDPEHWDFATGALIDVTALGEQVGLNFWHDETGNITHNLRTVVIDPSGRLRKIFNGNQWSSDDLIEEMKKAGK